MLPVGANRASLTTLLQPSLCLVGPLGFQQCVALRREVRRSQSVRASNLSPWQSHLVCVQCIAWLPICVQLPWEARHLLLSRSASSSVPERVANVPRDAG